jgi:endonuclease/exonuclease/phosphatase family metal-dependent hydrolase
MQFRIITYNIHKGIGGVDRRYRPERIISTLQHYEADIIFLQEVDNDVPRSQFHRQVDLIGDALMMKYRAFQHNVKLTRGHYGNAILSRYPLTDIENIDLTVSIKKRRRALVSHCHIKNGHQQSLLLINCHLGLAGFERSMQLRKILDSSAMKYIHKTTPVIIGGDYNDVWATLGKTIMIPSGFETVCKKVNTFPAILPVRQLDHIYYRGALSCIHSFPGHSSIARQASDHLPLIADFDFEI